MRIGLNAHLLPYGATYRSAGVATYERELVSRLPRIAPQHEFIIFTPPRHSGAGIVASRLPTYNPLARIAWEQAIAPIESWRRGIDVFHSPVNVSPMFLSTPTVVTVHDLAYLRFPDRFSRWKQRYLQTMVRLSVERAEAVITPSLHTKEDVIRAFGVAGERVTVIPEGVGEQFKPDPDSQSPIMVPYILCVGTVEPRKNLPVLLNAFAELKRSGYPHHLALVGARGWMYEDVDSAIRQLGLSESVIMPGFVDDLVPWYNHADLFVYPSSYEGFGLPPLEAMACGTPVIMSSAGSLSEVAGNAALLVPPENPGALLEAFRDVLDNESRRASMVRAGVDRAANFSWDDTMRRTLDVYQAVARNHVNDARVAF